MVKGEWSRDPMSNDVLTAYGDLQTVQRLDELSFLNTDSYIIQQNYWIHQLAKRLIANQDLGPFEFYRLAAGEMPDAADENMEPLAEVIQKLNDGLQDAEAEQLAVALKLFDWVIRNIHLLPEDNLTREVDDLNDLKLNDADDLIAAGVPGLGYTRFPWQTMLFSRGDYVDRARLFMQMLAQSGIDSVMLLVPAGKSGEQEARPWAVGVPVGEQLYLFDTRLGMPIPGESVGQIATWDAVKSNSGILDSLDLSVNESLKDETAYWVKSDQLDNVRAAVLAGPESLSYRFWELENKLVGDNRMKMVVRPTEVIDRLPELEGIQPVIWDIDFKTHQFRRALRDAVAEASYKDDIRDKISWYYSDESYIYDFVQYRTARSKYFNGLFETIRNDGNLNAIELFYKMIYKDSKIESLASDQIFQLQLALNQGKQSPAEFENTIRGVQANMRLVRRDSGFFLAQCHFDNGNFGTAENWLTRLEEIADTARWQAAINYLRGRSHEAQRNYDAAAEAYNRQNSEQFHGDLIRLRQLKKLTEAS
jgi:hypothetical protein